jgi:uncharacterized protein DUF4199
MKTVVIKYGVYGLVFAMALFLLGLYFGQGIDFSIQEVVGYSTMIAALGFVYFGIKHFRDKENGGEITFGKALTIGLLISVFTATGIAIADFIYTTIINPDFFEEYKAVMKAQGHEGEIPNYTSGFMAFIMFATVMIIGLVISLISSLILQRKN